MKTWLISAVVAMFLGAVTPVMADTPPELKQRIKTIYDADAPVNAKEYLAQTEPIMRDAQAAADISLDDFARISLIHALALYNDGRSAEARDIVAAAIERIDAQGGAEDNTFMSNLLMNYAVYQTHSGDPESGLETQKRALTMVQKSSGDDSVEAGSVYGTMASSSSLLGRQRDTLTYYRMSIERMDPEEDSAGSYVANLGNFANNLRVAGEYEEALKYSRMNIDAAGKYLPEGHRAFGYAYSNAADIMMALGRYREAEALFRQAHEFAQKYRGRSSFDTGLFAYNLARAMAAMGRNDEAEALMLESFAILEKTTTGSAPHAPALVWMTLGNISAERGDLDEAIAREHKALELLTPLGKRGDQPRAQIQVFLGEYLLQNGDLAGAQSQVLAGLEHYRTEFEPYAPIRIKAESLYALIRSRLGHTDEALRAGEIYVEAMTDNLRRGGARYSSTRLIETYGAAFARFADIAIAADRPDLAFSAAQRAAQSDISLTSQAVAARAATADPVAAQTVRALQDIQTQRFRLDQERNFARGKSAKEVERLDKEIAQVEQDLAELSGRLEAAFPDYGRISNPEPLSLSAVQAALPAGRAVILPLLGDDRVLTLAVTRGSLTWDVTALSRPAAERDINAIRASIDNALTTPDSKVPFARIPAWRLGGAIFTPKIMAALQDIRELDFMGAGKLMSLPPGVLLTQAPHGDDADPRALRDSAWLIRDFAISVKPAFVTAARDQGTARGFLGVGAPVLAAVGDGFTPFETAALFRSSERETLADVEALRRLPSLPNAEKGLARMRSALNLPGSRLMTGAQANETLLKSTDLSGYSVIAFATHGLVSGNLQALHEPALVLTPPDVVGADDDGLLTASEVAGLRLKARWVILSACNSGAGREAGSGYSGLAQAFMQAGADNLLVSMWPVRDDIADRLSVDTVQGHARGQSQAQALRRAVLALIRDRDVSGSAHPAIWAPFSLLAR